MTRDSTLLPFQHPEDFDDPLTPVLREGTRRLPAPAVEAKSRPSWKRCGRNVCLTAGSGSSGTAKPERTIQTRIGPVPVKRVKLRDPGGDEPAAGGEKITFRSAILPKWARRTQSLEALLPVLVLAPGCPPAISGSRSPRSSAGTRRTCRLRRSGG